MSEEAKPARKIKPPSASFLKSREVPPSSEGPAIQPRNSQEGLLGAPSAEAPPDQDLFVVPEPAEAPPESEPAPVDKPEPEPAAEVVASIPEEAEPAVEVEPEPVSPSAPEPEASRPAPSQPLSDAGLAERLLAELRELRDIVNSVDSLQYLRSRLNRAVEEGADSLTLVSFYRLVVRSLNEQTDQARRDFETMRSKANKLELELATSLAQGDSGEARPATTGISAEAEARLGQLEQEVAAANEQREKLLLDFKNMRERTQKDLNIQLFRDKEKFFKRFLPVLDSFERAQQSLNESSSVSSMLEGFRLISNQLNEALAAEGLEPIPTDGPFDPRFHEAVGEVQNHEKPDDYCYDELSRGYKLGERLIRPAMVRISRNTGAPSPPAEAGES